MLHPLYALHGRGLLIRSGYAVKKQAPSRVAVRGSSGYSIEKAQANSYNSQNVQVTLQSRERLL